MGVVLVVLEKVEEERTEKRAEKRAERKTGMVVLVNGLVDQGEAC